MTVTQFSRRSGKGAVVLSLLCSEIFGKSSWGAVDGYLRSSPSRDSYSGALLVAWSLWKRLETITLSPREALEEEMWS